MSQEGSRKSDRGRSRVRGTGVGQRSGSKRMRSLPDELDRDQTHEIGLDPDYFSDRLLGNLSTDEALLERFVQHLFQLPGIQDKISEQMSTASNVATTAVSDNAVSENHTSGETVSMQTATTLAQSMERLAVAVAKLNVDLETSKQRCDDLEQYSRRNNIIISNVPVIESCNLETQVCNV